MKKQGPKARLSVLIREGSALRCGGKIVDNAEGSRVHDGAGQFRSQGTTLRVDAVVHLSALGVVLGVFGLAQVVQGEGVQIEDQRHLAPLAGRTVRVEQRVFDDFERATRCANGVDL